MMEEMFVFLAQPEPTNIAEVEAKSSETNFSSKQARSEAGIEELRKSTTNFKTKLMSMSNHGSRERGQASKKDFNAKKQFDTGSGGNGNNNCKGKKLSSQALEAIMAEDADDDLKYSRDL
ncbi:hypothetical protein ACOSQ3_027412 [Xanthoceras sorbifolium]